MDLRTFAQDPSRWRFKRMSAQRLVVRSVPPTAVTAETLDVITHDAPRPLPWAFGRAPTPERDPRHPDFEIFDERSVVAPTESRTLAWLDAAAKATDDLRNSKLHPLVLNSELPHWMKLNVQRGTPVDNFVAAFGPGITQGEVPALFRDVCMHIAKVYARYYDGAYRAGPDPADTNAGWPTFRSGQTAKLVGNMLGPKNASLDRIKELGLKFSAAKRELVEPTTHAFGISTRTGPVYKMLPQNAYLGGSAWSTVFEAAGAQTRRRPVMMAWCGGNRRIRPLYNALMSARMRVPGLWHAGGPNFRRVAPYRWHYAADISGYDRSVTASFQRTVADAWRMFATLIGQGETLHPTIDIWEYLESRPLVTPFWGLSDGLVTVVNSGSGEHSGMKTTSAFGTFGDEAMLAYALHRLGIANYSEYPYGDRLAILVSGDDSRIGCEKPIPADGFAAACAELGLTVELLQAGDFLATHLSPVLWNAPLAGRIVQQTMSNEKERVDEESKLGLAYLGFLARTERADRLPPALLQAAWQVVQHAKWIEDLGGGKGLLEFKQMMIESSAVRAEIERALDDLKGTTWFDDLWKASEHSAAAAATLRLLMSMKKVLGLDALTRAYVVEAVADVTDGWDDAQILEYATRGYDSVAAGGDAAQKWFATVISKTIAI